jgi:Asp-tRNA(Asn)/Glu-tRNA(Gln) amidotransferase A subunit family amidase
MSPSLNSLSAREIAAGVLSGAFSALDVVEACLARIAEREPDVGAWVHLDPEHARAQARAVDSVREKGPLAGVPFGVKDVIDTHDMPTGMGSPIYDGHRPPADATCVAQVRQAGAVILGKTVTCEFAGLTPRATRNPHDPARTPGGSSSGSGAAVADLMAAAAFGTQTGGSVIRPSSYCGIVGFKPGFDTYSLKGVFPAAESLDTLGLHARTVDDIALLDAVLARRPETALPPLEGGHVIGLCRTWMWDSAQPETRAAVQEAATALAAAGIEVREVELPPDFERLGAMRAAINNWERAFAMGDEWRRFPDRLSEQMRATVSAGLAMERAEYDAALVQMGLCRALTEHAFAGCDVLLTPAVDGEAPVGLAATGSPQFQALWTMLHVPTITLPTHRGPNGMPVGIQLVGRPRGDLRLLAIAAGVAETLS